MKKQDNWLIWLVSLVAALCLMTAMAMSAGSDAAKEAERKEKPPKAAVTPAQPPALLLISIDGLRPDAVLQAERHGLKVPNLLRMVSDGAYATGVRGVLPTVTYPSHTTLITGASPARHGIYTNTTFDPFNRNEQGWYWYAEDIQVPTLWDAARQAGLKTANVHWPVSVGAAVDYNLPQLWRTGTADDTKLLRALETPGMEAELAAALKEAYPLGKAEDVDSDEKRARFAIELLKRKRPGFATIYLTGLDTEEHHSGPFSKESNAVLERLDAVLGQLREAAETAYAGHVWIAVVSDHGFAAVQHDVNLYTAFIEAGMITINAAGDIKAWEAEPWPSGGSAAVVLREANNAAVAARVHELLERLAADPENGIERIVTKEELRQAGGFPGAEAFVAFRLGYELGFSMKGALVSPPHYRGMHGYLASHDEMLSSFFVTGPGVKAGKNLGEIDMRQIAPALAGLLGVKLEAAEKPAVELR